MNGERFASAIAQRIMQWEDHHLSNVITSLFTRGYLHGNIDVVHWLWFKYPHLRNYWLDGMDKSVFEIVKPLVITWACQYPDVTHQCFREFNDVALERLETLSFGISVKGRKTFETIYKALIASFLRFEETVPLEERIRAEKRLVFAKMLKNTNLALHSALTVNGIALNREQYSTWATNRTTWQLFDSHVNEIEKLMYNS
jgi:hypothetical protein